MGSKKALLVGCNYPGSDSELKGCVNDVMKMRVCLMERFGFAEEDITVLVDTDEELKQPTGANVRQSLMDLVSSAAPDDVLVFHFSGHGTRIPAENDADDETGYDECIYLTDSDLIKDDEFRELVNMVPIGCRITIISDSCHSGGLIEQAEEQIGDSTGGGDEEPSQEEPCVKSRSLPFSKLIEILKQKSGKEEISVGELSTTLTEIFDKESYINVKEFIMVQGYIQQLQEQHEQGSEEFEDFKPREGKRGLPTNGVLISGCQTDQTSADANPTGDPADAYGALTNAILMILDGTEGEISNRDLVARVRDMMVEKGYNQEPGLYCSDELADAPFIC